MYYKVYRVALYINKLPNLPFKPVKLKQLKHLSFL